MILFKRKEEKSDTGIFIFEGKNMKPLCEIPDEGSVVEIVKSLGYSTHNTIHTFNSEKISFIVFHRKTKNPIFLEMKDNSMSLTYSEVKKEIEQIDWDFQFRQLDFEDNNT